MIIFLLIAFAGVCLGLCLNRVMTLGFVGLAVLLAAPWLLVPLVMVCALYRRRA